MEMEERGKEEIGSAPADRVEAHPAAGPPASVAGLPRNRWKWVLAAGGASALLAIVLGLAVGLTTGRSWAQPAAPRRAFNFKRFQSCNELREAFDAKRVDGLPGGRVPVRPDSNALHPAYHSDYCEYCDCSSNGEDYNVHGEPMMTVCCGENGGEMRGSPCKLDFDIFDPHLYFLSSLSPSGGCGGHGECHAKGLVRSRRLC